MAIASNLGFSRVGARRALKFALEAYWSGKADEAHLREVGRTLRHDHWLLQQQAGIQHIPSNDFSFYDHVLDTAAMVGAIPARYGWPGKSVDLTTYFAMARGILRSDHDAKGMEGASPPMDIIAMEMTKWFDTNYHYIVPEFEPDQQFSLSSTQFLDAFLEAKRFGVHTRPVLLGPVSFLLLGKYQDTSTSSLQLLPRLLPVYEEALRGLADAGADWVQMDEPYLSMDLTEASRSALTAAYTRLSQVSPRLRLLVASYFEGMRDNLETALRLPIAALHLDLVRCPSELEQALLRTPPTLSLSLGVVDGRNIWKSDLKSALQQIQRAESILGPHRVLIAPSCSLLHVPVDLDLEVALDPESRGWLAFAKQKLEEVAILARATQDPAAVSDTLSAYSAVVEHRRRSPRIHQEAVSQRAAAVLPAMRQRSNPHSTRKMLQQTHLNLPLFPTTTIGSFPQTSAVRTARAAWRTGQMETQAYEVFLRKETEKAIRFQEETGIDLLVHGEFERNDMVEYFGEQLDGFIFTQNGWVQSYGSRCVKPPIIFGDVRRPKPMTVAWSQYAQSLTTKPVKGMLTGPVTILKWSFVRDDQPLADTCRQIALAIRDEVADLESAGISVIQIDEPALREGLPLRRADWGDYLTWAVEAFRLATAVARDATQIHTHMCYAEFGDIIEAVAEMDADVISIETSRSQMALLSAFSHYRYPNDIGPGVYDIHSPRIPMQGEMEHLLQKALDVLPAAQLWVNPDCGLKTRSWEEVAPALAAMVATARHLRSLFANRA